MRSPFEFSSQTVGTSVYVGETSPDSWKLRGACREVEDPEIFHPVESNEMAQREGKRICCHCPVLSQCRTYAMTHDEAGIWGGLSERDRRRIKRDMARDRLVGVTDGARRRANVSKFVTVCP